MLVLLFAGCFYQLAVFLYSPGQVWRIWQVLLWGVLMSYNVVSVIFPNEELPVPLSLQYIFRYGVGFLLGSCFPLYFYKAHGITEFAIHVRFGLPVCYGLPFLLFFVIMFPLGKDLELILYWVMALPVIYTYSLFGVLSLAVYRKFGEKGRLHFDGNLEELLLSCISVAPWLVASLFVYLKVDPWVELWCTNIGFLLVWLLIVARDVRRKVVELRLSVHHSVEQQLTFQDSCFAYGLSKREVEVAELLCAGLTYREIGEQLYISLHTVDNHVRHIFAKVEVNRKMDLLAKLRPDGNG